MIGSGKMQAQLQPRTGDALIVIVTDDAGKQHRVHYWPDDNDTAGALAETKAIEYVKKRISNG